MIPLSRAFLCENCAVISEANSERCPACSGEGCLLSLSRILNPNPTIGMIDFLLAPRKFIGETVSLKNL